MSPITTSLASATFAVGGLTALISMRLGLPPLAVYLTTLTLYTFVIMGKDKLTAAKNKGTHGRGRTPETALFILALAGGTLGIFAGQYLFKHKTTKPSFLATLAGVMLIQLATLAYFFIL